jgi:ATP-dependent DNA helicase RecG
MTKLEIEKLIDRLLKLPKECEWVEFKLNLKTEEEIGKYISALSNGACLQNKPYGYLVFGIDDKSFLPVGTTFKPNLHKIGKEEFEHWVMQRLSPRVEVLILETTYQDKHISLFQIQAAQGQPTCFSHQDYIRVGSITRSLKEFPEKEKKIWTKAPKQIFEKGIAMQVSSSEKITNLLDTQCFFSLLNIPYPSNLDAVIQKFISERFIRTNDIGYSITNLGALLFAKDLEVFDSVKRKTIRVIQYDDKSKIKTIKEQQGKY